MKLTVTPRINEGEFVSMVVEVEVSSTVESEVGINPNEVGATIAKYNGKPLVRGGAFEVVEGDYQPRRMIIIEFSDMATLKAWYDSDDYAALKQMRKSSSSSNIIAVEGM